MNIELVTQTVSEWAAKLPYKVNVYLFGSQLKGSANHGSDVDLAVEFPELKSETERTLYWIDNHQTWEECFTKKIGKKVDLQLYEQNRSPHLKAYLAENSVLIYSSS